MTHPQPARKTGHRPLAAAHYKDARVHYPDLKQQPHTGQPRASHSDTDPVGQLKPSSLTADASEPQQCAPTPTPTTRPEPGRAPDEGQGDNRWFH